VVDTEGNAVVGASVLVEGTTRGALTDALGDYTITNVPAGSQTIQVSYIGLRGMSQTVQVTAGGTATANFTMAVDPLQMEGIVVTGSARPVEKQESSVAITTMSSVEITEKSPQSGAELLEVVPGFYVEASGGQAGNNVWARGIPQDGSFRYVAVHEDGLPVYESPELAFTNVDLLYRMDETVRQVEAVRGGAAAVFASNAPGGVINILSKTGGEEFAGTAKLTVGDYNLFRADLNIGGPLFGEDWRFNIGGFYRFDRGVRDPEFPANTGGQIKANITRLLDNGYIRVYGKFLDEQNIFYLPVPLQNTSTDSLDVEIDEIPGFDPNYGTLTSLDAQIVKFPTPDDEVRTVNLREGMHPSIFSLGAEALFEVGDGWTIKEAFRYMKSDVTFNAIFSIFNPTPADAFADDRVDATPGGVDYQYRFASSGEAISAGELDNLNGNGLVVESGWWNVTKPLENFANDLRVTRSWANNTFTGGFYFSQYTADELWIFNNILLEVRDAPRLLDLEVLDGGGDVISRTDNGFTQYGWLYKNAANSANLFAFYAEDEWQATERLRIDVGGRFEWANFDGNVEAQDQFDLGNDATFADDAMNWGTGRFLPYNHSFEEFALSGGLNYELTPTLNLYGRATKGFRMPDFEQWNDGGGANVDNKGEAEDIFQAEGGLKYASSNLGIFASVFYSTLTDIPFTDEVVDPGTGQGITLRRKADARTIGLEAEVVWLPAPGFRFDLRGTAQNPELTSMTFEPPADPADFEDFDFSGNRIRRVPRYIFNARPSYEFQVRGAPKFWVDFWWLDKRFTDDANTEGAALPSYTKVAAGFSFDISPQVGFLLVGNNLFNSIGLTEGNPRVGQVVAEGGQQVIMARPILGRNVRASISYRF
jgi:outer membrane receptor protein involved in Fe transport